MRSVYHKTSGLSSVFNVLRVFQQALVISNEVFKNIFILLSSREKPYLLTKEEAIIYGLFLRANKLFCSFIRLTIDDDSVGAVFLCRGITDCLIDMMYLASQNSKVLFDDYVQLPFHALKEQLEEINKNQEVNGPIPIEKRIKKSIYSTLRKSGYNPKILDDLPPKKENKWVKIGIKEKLKTLGYKNMFLFLQTNSNNAIHGNWDVVLIKHLEYIAENAYKPKMKDTAVRPQMILGINRLLCEAAMSFIQWNFINEELDSVYTRIVI